MNITAEQVIPLVKTYYGLTVTAKPLTGEYEFNFLLTATDDTKYILKIASDEHSCDFFDAQVKIVQHLQRSEVADRFFKYIPANDGNLMLTLELEERKVYLRLLSFLEGEFWIDTPHRPDELHYDLGNFLGKMDKALQNFSHPAMHRPYIWDISRTAEANRK